MKNRLNRTEIISKTVKYVRKELLGESSGHDWWHILRVWNNAKHIGKSEKVDMFVVELAALLHDIADWKFHGGDENVGAIKAKKWLKTLDVDAKTIDHVCDIIATSSFKGARQKTKMKTKEGEVVQDADRLDAIGAIGIGRRIHRALYSCSSSTSASTSTTAPAAASETEAAAAEGPSCADVARNASTHKGKHRKPCSICERS